MKLFGRFEIMGTFIIACTLDLPEIEIFDHVNEIVAALCHLRNENGTSCENAQKALLSILQLQKEVQTKRASR